MDINKLNEWSASVCNVELHGHEYIVYESDAGDKIYAEWNLEDPRCMQVFREKFEIDTNCTNDSLGKWCAVLYRTGDDHITEGVGEKIHEAELACALAIYEAEHAKTEG